MYYCVFCCHNNFELCPITAFPDGCYSDKKNVLVVSSVGSRRSSSIIASSSDNTPAAGLISSINNE